MSATTPSDTTTSDPTPSASTPSDTTQAEAELDAGSLFLMEAFDPANRTNPYPLYAKMREQSPVFDAGNNLWFTFSHKAANSLLRAKNVSSDERRSNFYRETVAQGEMPQHVIDREPSLLFLDPPDHDRLRGLVNSAFTQRTVERLVPRIKERANALFDAMDTSEPVDLVEHLAYPLPVAVICELLGVPEEDHEQFGSWSKDLTKGLDPAAVRSEEDEESIIKAEADLQAYTSELLVRRQAEPGDDLLSALLAARDGEDRITEPELISLTVLLLVAGHETTVNLIGNGAVALLRNRDQLARWQADPSMTKTAVDELLRYDSPVQMGMRITVEPTEIEGVTIPAYDQVLTLLGAANRDPKMFEEPDRLDLSRQNAARHLSFGGGIHHCLGMALARTEGQVALGGLVARFPDIELLEEPPIRDRFVLRGYEQIMVRPGRQASPT